MPTYRLLWRNAQGHLTKSRSVDCSSAQRAIDLAASEIGSHRLIEVLDGTQPVGRHENPAIARAAGRTPAQEQIR